MNEYCPLNISEANQSSCIFWRDKCRCDSLPKTLIHVIAGKGHLLAWPGSRGVKRMDDITLEIMEKVLNSGVHEGIGSIQGIFLNTVVAERLHRYPENNAN